MSDAAYYRGEALRFLQFARKARNGAVRRRWQRLVDDYLILAAQLDAAGGTPLLRFSEPQPQPVQQQQGKLGSDEPPWRPASAATRSAPFPID